MSSISTQLATAHVDAPGIVADRARVPGYFYRKHLLDRFLAALLLIPGLPLIGTLIVLIRASSKGPGIFKQVRTGKDGREYVMYKLRSMRCDAEENTGPVWSQASNPHITWLGRWLRKLHLDELPQLLNVVRGEMSLVGPRPERPEFVEVLKHAIPGYTGRLVVLPGITGLAQINLPPDSDLDSVRRKQILDLQYIQRGSLLLDMRILLATALRIVGIPGSVAAHVTGLQQSVNLDLAAHNADGPHIGSTADTTTLTSIARQLRHEHHGNGHTNSHGHANGIAAGNLAPQRELVGEPSVRRPK